VATETITRLVDDLDGSAAERTISFGLDGHVYEIELNAKNIARLEKVLKPFLAAARSTTPPTRRRTAGPRRSTPRSTQRGPRRDLSAVREWARANGYDVTGRGRIPALVMQAYEAAQ
jgi:Lsr2